MARPLQVIDGHNDTLLNLYMPERGGGRDFFHESESGHIDLPRARQGGLASGFFAIFVPNPNTSRYAKNNLNKQEFILARSYCPPAIDPGYAQSMTQGMIAQLFQLEQQSSGAFRVVRSVSEIENCLKQDILGAILHFEGAESIDTNLDALQVYHAAGLRSLGLVWSRPNAFATGVPFAYGSSPDTGPGLTESGKELVKECNALHIMIDLSHLNEQGFWDVAKISDAPLVATHSAVHAICPHSRNLTDKQIDSIAATGGVVGVNCYVGNIRPDGNCEPDTPLSDWVSHVDYLVDRMGIDHVAIGSDFDGATMPENLKDVSGLPKLIAALSDNGYSHSEVSKIAHNNWLAVLKQTWD